MKLIKQVLYKIIDVFNILIIRSCIRNKNGMYCLMHEGLILLVSTTSNVTVESMMHAAVE